MQVADKPRNAHPKALILCVHTSCRQLAKSPYFPVHTHSIQPTPSNVLLYQTDDGNFRLDVPTDGDTVWLTQQQMAELFGKARPTIVGHIQNVFEEGELDEGVVCRDFRHTTPHGAIEGKTQSKNVRHYNLDVIISVGYRVKSLRGTQFRKPPGACPLVHSS